MVGDQNKEDMGEDEGFGDWDDNQNKQSNEDTQSKSGKEIFGDFDEAPGTTVGSQPVIEHKTQMEEKKDTVIDETNCVTELEFDMQKETSLQKSDLDE